MATIKITKNDRYNQLLAIEEVAANPDLVAFIEHEQELLSRKNATKNGKQTKAQAENAVLAEQVENAAHAVLVHRDPEKGIAHLIPERQLNLADGKFGKEMHVCLCDNCIVVLHFLDSPLN